MAATASESPFAYPGENGVPPATPTLDAVLVATGPIKAGIAAPGPGSEPMSRTLATTAASDNQSPAETARLARAAAAAASDNQSPAETARLARAASGASPSIATAGPAATSSTTISVSGAGYYDPTILTNPLHEYTDYTYSLSLHLLTVPDYNRIISNPEKEYVPNNVLISSAGKWGQDFVRNPYFKEDFYFDDLRMTTVIGTTQRNRTTNLVECSFTIIEPSGFTLINRLMSAVDQASKLDNSKKNNDNYIRQPYLLKIDFYGSKDGEISNTPIKVGGQDITKIIPITIIGIKSKVTTRGTEYQVKAAPFNHQAFTMMNDPIPTSCTVKGITVQDIFGVGKVSSEYKQLIRQQEDQKKQLELTVAGANSASGLDTFFDFDKAQQQIDDLRTKLKTSFPVSGITDAINSWHALLKDLKQIEQANEIYVEFHPDIANAKLYGGKPAPSSQEASSGTNADETKAAANLPVGTLKYEAGILNIPYGQRLTFLIDWVVRNSDYIRSQMADPEATPPENSAAALGNKAKDQGPLRWFRIVPKIEIGEYDNIRHYYKFKITLYVKPWTLNTVYPYVSFDSKLGIEKKYGYVKEYNWFFTGQNSDVTDLQVDFDLMYYVEVTALKSKNAFLEAQSKGLIPATQASTDSNVNTKPKNISRGKEAKGTRDQPIPTQLVSKTNQSSPDGYNPGENISASDAQKTFTLGARGDMISVKLTILGDPQFIKQDDIFYNQTLDQPQGLLTKNNSLITDAGELYVFVKFKTPIDYDEKYGLAKPGIGNEFQLSDGQYTGIYKVIKVENRFSKGKFEQVLDLAKIPIQDKIATQPDPGVRLESLLPAPIYFGQNPSFSPGRGAPSIPIAVQRQLQTADIGRSLISGAGVASGIAAGGLGGLLSSIGTAVTNTLVNKGTTVVTDYIKSSYQDFRFNQSMDAFKASQAEAGLGPGNYEQAAENNFGYGSPSTTDAAAAGADTTAAGAGAGEAAGAGAADTGATAAEGAGIGSEINQVVESISSSISNAVGNVVDFIKGLFS